MLSLKARAYIDGVVVLGIVSFAGAWLGFASWPTPRPAGAARLPSPPGLSPVRWRRFCCSGRSNTYI